MMPADKPYTGLEIAVIGMSGLFPGGNDHREFWQNLKEGRESIRFLSDEELRANGVPDTYINDAFYIRSAGGRVENKDLFDHYFFGYTPEEAALMDPQTRIFHQVCWGALEDAGYAAGAERFKIGLFAGAAANTNWQLYVYGRQQSGTFDPHYLTMLTSPNFIPTLVAYKLNLRGPAVFVDSACSTSLTAVHLACRSLLTKECNIALAGGIAIQTARQTGYFYQEGRVLSKDGHCRTFDAAASGTATGEGAGIVVLKRLNDAIRDGDHIYAIIRATSVNNDGSRKAGYTAPGVKGQVDCILMAQKLASATPESITYVEAHGTGTRLGDPIEVEALNAAFGYSRDHRCALGSVKTNIGHLDTAAGVAGLIKAVLSLKYRQLPASLHYRESTPGIDFSSGPFYVNTELREWEGARPLRAGVSSFGIGGTNAHAVLEEAPLAEAGVEGRRWKLLVLSGRTAESVERYVVELRDFVEREKETDLWDLCYTLQVGRRELGYRRFEVFRDGEELLRQLSGGGVAERAGECRGEVVFMFPGQGSQYAKMGLGLYESEGVFREQLDRGFSVLRELTGEDYKGIWLGEVEGINGTQYAQPLLWLVGYGLAKLMGSMGIEGSYMIGHSIGEYVAASLSGVWDFEDALRVVVKRGSLMSGVGAGVMLGVGLSEGEVSGYLGEGLWLAAVNGPQQVVLSGWGSRVGEVEKELSERGIVCRRLHTSHAFHSGMQDEILGAYGSALREIGFGELKRPFISNVTGDFISKEAAVSAEYWVRHLREPVRYSAGVERLLGLGREPVFLELGAGHSLSGLVRQQAGGGGIQVENLIRSVREEGEDGQYLGRRLGRLWSRGLTIDWGGYYGRERRRRISLPTYCFEPVSYPAEVDPFEKLLPIGNFLVGQAENKELKDWLYFPCWRRTVPPPIGMERRSYLYFSTKPGFSLPLREVLESRHHDVVEVIATESYTRYSGHQYSINPAIADHYRQLLADQAGEGKPVTDIIYAWGIDTDRSRISLSEENRELNRTYFGLAYLIRALLQENLLKGKRIAVLTKDLYRVIGNEQVNCVQSLLLGLVNAMPQEYSLTCFQIDISAGDVDSGGADRLADEILGNDGGRDRIVALRNGQRWLQDYQKNPYPIQAGSGSIHEGGVYLITGGLGNLGRTIASYLLCEYHATLILTGRKEWAMLDEDTLNAYHRLAGMGGNVHYYCSDIADAVALERTVCEVEGWAGRISGVIHAAGITDDHYFEPVAEITAAKALPLLAPKVAGLLNIYRVFRERQPDFVWISSSLSAVLGGLGFAAYSSANCFMDHFLISLSGELPTWRCVDLGGIAFSEQEVRKEGRQGRSRLLPEEIGVLLEWSLMVKGNPVIIQSVEELSARLRRGYEIKKEAYLDDPGVTGPAPEKAARPGLSTGYVASSTVTESRLTVIYEKFFGIAGIGIKDNFFELGGDSLRGMMLLKRIRQEFDADITLSDFLMNPAIGLLAEKIDERTWLKTDAGFSNELVI
jgi:acyl transferase domain-containing protein